MIGVWKILLPIYLILFTLDIIIGAWWGALMQVGFIMWAIWMGRRAKRKDIDRRNTHQSLEECNHYQVDRPPGF